jgi:hypothetical protein
MANSDAALGRLHAIFASADRDRQLSSIISTKDTVLARFRPLLNPAAISRLQPQQYESFLSFRDNCHWTNLGRTKHFTLGNMDALRSGLDVLLDESQSIGHRIDKLENSIPGVGMAILTAILLLAHPNAYGVWNGTTEKALKALHLWPAFPRGMSLGGKYEAINGLLLRLASDLNIDLWTLDALFWRVVKPSKATPSAYSSSPDELPEGESFPEGAKRQVTVNAYERSVRARTQCIRHWGCQCYVCGFDFVQFYGELGRGIIHVHHLVPVADMGGEYALDPVWDLRPVCPNCHAVLHRSTLVMPIEELRARLGR